MTKIKSVPTPKMLREVKKFLRAENYTEAIQYLLGILKKYPENSDAMKSLAFCYLKTEENKKALKLLLKAQKREPESFWLDEYIGICYSRLEKYQDALTHYLKVESFKPNDYLLLERIAYENVRLYLHGDFSEAKKKEYLEKANKYFQKAKQITPEKKYHSYPLEKYNQKGLDFCAKELR